MTGWRVDRGRGIAGVIETHANGVYDLCYKKWN